VLRFVAYRAVRLSFEVLLPAKEYPMPHFSRASAIPACGPKSLRSLNNLRHFSHVKVDSPSWLRRPRRHNQRTWSFWDPPRQPLRI